VDKLLITGGTGYIGGKLAQFYASSGKEVRLLVRNRDGLDSSLRRTCEVFVGDLINQSSLDAAVKDVSFIIHSAGCLGAWGKSYEDLYKVNAIGVKNLIDACIRCGGPRFIHLSAGGVTGPLPSASVDESYSPAPYTDYEKSKWEGEKIALKMAVENDLNLLVLRPTFTYGPGDPHKLSLFTAIQKGRFAFIGKGTSTIHPVYIDDLINGINLALTSPIKQRALIIGGGRPFTKRELVQTIADILNCPMPRSHIPEVPAILIAGIAEIIGNILHISPPLTRSRVLMMAKNWGYSIEAARKELGYQPQIDLREGIKRTVAWYREQGWL
jgi:nucleoside-diphosphate-sugar epimerase